MTESEVRNGIDEQEEERDSGLKLTKDKSKPDKSSNEILMDSEIIKCVEEHQVSNPIYFPKDRKACEWGKKNKKVKTCGECPFGIMILNYTPAYRDYLEYWHKNLVSWNWPVKYIHLFQNNGIKIKKPTLKPNNKT